MQVTYPSLSKAHYPDDLSSNRYQPNSKLPERLIQRVSSVIQYSVHQVGDTPLQAHDALSTIKSAQDKTALRISKHSSVPGHTADRLKARQADLKLIYSAVSSNEIQLIGFIGWGDSTLTHVNSGQGISEYDSVVFLKDGVKYVEQLGSSYLRSRLALPPVKFATSSNSTPKLTPTGAVYNPETWRRVDSGNDSATLTVDRWPGTVSAHRGRADSIESQNSEISEPDELPTHSHPGLPSLKHEIEAYLEEHRPDLDRAIRSKNTTNILTELRNESQRHHTLQNGPKGLIPTVYTDLNAYGNPLEIAREISRHIERVVGNTHGTSQLAKVSTHYLNQAVAGILAHFGATPFKPGETDAQSSYDIVVRGAGFTGAFDEYLNHVKADLSRRGIALESGAISFTEYEHHSNSLPFQTWVGAATPATQLPITEAGTLDLDAFDHFLESAAKRNAPYILTTLSLQSNVTSVKTDLAEIEQRVQEFITRHPEYSDKLYLSFDLAAYAPHGELDLGKLTRTERIPLIDAIAFSPYKLDGGQQGSGIAIIRSSLTDTDSPRLRGGGTVGNVYSATEAGTRYNPLDRFDFNNAGSPNVMGIVNTYLGLYFKELIGTQTIHHVESEYTTDVYRALNNYKSTDNNTRIRILGPADLSVRGNTLPIIVEIYDSGGWRQLPPGFVGQALEHFTGVVTRSGCNCAGPYAYALFGLTATGSSEKMADYLTQEDGASIVRPGWTRATLSPLLTRGEIEYFKWAWQWFAENSAKILNHYRFNPETNGYDLVNKTIIPITISVQPGQTSHAGGSLVTFPRLNAPDILLQRQEAVVRYTEGFKNQTDSGLRARIITAWRNWDHEKS